MRMKLESLGNSLAVRIPQTFVTEAGLEQQSEVDISIVDGALVITPSPVLTLEDLLAQVTDENLHDEIDTGFPIGREVW